MLGQNGDIVDRNVRNINLYKNKEEKVTALIKKLFGKIFITRELSIEEKISKAENKYSGMELVTKILQIEGLETKDGSLAKPELREAWYRRTVDLCAKYAVDFAIPCDGPGC